MTTEDEKDEEVEEFEDEDFDAELDDEELDLDGLEEGDDDFDDEEAEPSRSSGRDKYSDAAVAEAVQANPKRQQARKRNRRTIEGILDAADMRHERGQNRAFARLQEENDDTVTKPFEMGMELRVNDVLEHPTFGLGFVISEDSTTKVSVLFEDGIRKLVCDNPD